MKHIKQDSGLKAWVRASGVDLGGGAEAKINLFQNMVMLHIILQFGSKKLLELGNICLISLIIYLPLFSNQFNRYDTLRNNNSDN